MHCIEEPQGQPQAQGWAKTTQEARSCCTDGCSLRAAEHKPCQQREKTGGKVQRKPGRNFQEGAPYAVVDDVLDLMSDDPCQASWSREYRARKGVCPMSI